MITVKKSFKVYTHEALNWNNKFRLLNSDVLMKSLSLQQVINADWFDFV